MQNLKKVSPWVEYYRKLVALFKKDPDIRIIYDEGINVIKMYINGQDKYEALNQLLPSEKKFGNVTLKIELIPCNDLKLSRTDLFRRAFSGNPVVTDVISIGQEIIGSTNDFNYVVFEKEVVQYYDDSLGDPHGNRSTLYQEIAKEVFGEQDGIYFCTDKE
jgi:hypothetical protein